MLVTLLLAACGSGIPDNKKLGDLTDEELMELCLEGGAATFECDTTGGGELEITVGIEDTCEELTADSITEDCSATAGDYRACDEAVRSDPCASELPLVCLSLFLCLDTTITIE